MTGSSHVPYMTLISLASEFINLFLFALVVVFWGTWFSLSRSIGSITPTGFLEIGRTMIANLGENPSLGV